MTIGERESIWTSSSGLILCGEKKQERIDLLQLDQGGSGGYLAELPPSEVLVGKVDEATRLAREQVERGTEI